MFLANNTDEQITFTINDVQIILESGEVIFYNPFIDTSQQVARLVRDGYLFLYDEDDNPEYIMEELKKNISISKLTLKKEKSFSNIKFKKIDIDQT